MEDAFKSRNKVLCVEYAYVIISHSAFVVCCLINLALHIMNIVSFLTKVFCCSLWVKCLVNAYM